MKIALQFFVLMLCSFASIAQSTVNIQINHLLEGIEYENEVNATNNLGNDFKIDRLQYYLSGFSIVHDGGQVTEVEDLYVLVSLLESSEPTLIELGEYDIESLESVRFYYGVNDQANHADPSSWDSNHPLAPKFPSMHWGWAAGYRFIALEGMSGPNLNQVFEFHCIGDEFYSQIEFPVSMSGQSSYTVTLDADYKQLLGDINISSGLIIHGGTGEMPVLVSNLTKMLFVLSSITSNEDSELVNSFDVFPNPVTKGTLNIKMDIATSNNSVKVFDSVGKVIFNKIQSPAMQIEISDSGLYYVSIADINGKIIASRKVIVQ